MNKPVILISRKGERLEFLINAVPSLDGFDKLVLFFKNYYNADLLESYDDHIFARRYVFTCQNRKVELHHDDIFGNCLYSPSSDDDLLVQEVADNLNTRLRG